MPNKDNVDNYINKVGFSEMYEWNEIPAESPYGLFVGISDTDPNKIDLVKSSDCKQILGVTTIQSTVTSDDPETWKYAYMCNEVGDKFLKNEMIAIGVEEYDQIEEFSYISTKPFKHFVQVPNKYFDQSKEYVPRSKRREWVRVNLIGKCIVRDNGECQPGEYCQPNTTGKSKIMRGWATPANMNENGWKFFILRRLTQNTIEILNSPLLNKYIANAEDEQKKDTKDISNNNVL